MDDGLVESAHGGGQSRKEEATGPGNGLGRCKDSSPGHSRHCPRGLTSSSPPSPPLDNWRSWPFFVPSRFVHSPLRPAVQIRLHPHNNDHNRTPTPLQHFSNSDSNPNSSFPPIFAAPPMMFSASAASSSIRCPWLLLLLLALMAALLQSANAQAPLDQQIAAAEKRSPPAVRNPYSWMAAADVETDKRSALRRPQNPYSWMAANEEPGTGQWTLSRLRPFQALMAKRLTGSSGGSRTGPSRNPYSWTNF